MITSSSLYPLSVLTGSHIDFVSLRVLALPGLYLRDKSNCLSLDRLLPLLPSVSLCAKICQVKSLHTLKSRFTTCRFGRTLQMAYLSTDPPTWNVTNMTAQHTCKNIHKLTDNVITLWRHDYTQSHKTWVTSSFLRYTDFFISLCVLSWEEKKSHGTIACLISTMHSTTIIWHISYCLIQGRICCSRFYSNVS